MHFNDFGRAFRLHDKIVQEDLAAMDEKTYSAMILDCLAAGAIQEAAMVLRCAYHLPCEGGLAFARGSPRGVDAICISKVLTKLAFAEAEALEAELAFCGVAVPKIRSSARASERVGRAATH